MIPQVSVIVCFYNQENYVVQTLESILSQERNFPIEVIVNDDCSTDSTSAILKQFEKEYPDIVKIYYQQINRGVVFSFYSMIELCTGKYIMECGGDDYWLQGKMKMQYEYMEAHPEVGMCYGKVQVLFNNKIVKVFGDNSGESFSGLLFRGGISSLTTCYRRDVVSLYLKDVCPMKMKWTIEDLPLFLWFAQNSIIKFLDKEMGVYRVLKGSISHPVNIDKKIEYFKMRKIIMLYFSNGNKKYNKLINESYARGVAVAYLDCDDIKNFRRSNKCGGIKGLIKNIISFLPGGISYLKIRAM